MDASEFSFAIVVARFNEAITSKLLEGATAALQKCGAGGVEVFQVPGSFELPLAAKIVAEDYDAVIALGAVVRGETPHFEYVCSAAAQGLQDVALESGTPVAFGVLTTDTLEQAAERAGGAHGNKGWDAALTAIEMAHFRAHNE